MKYKFIVLFITTYFLLLLCTTAYSKSIYRCVNDRDKVTFQGSPCENSPVKSPKRNKTPKNSNVVNIESRKSVFEQQAITKEKKPLSPAEVKKNHRRRQAYYKLSRSIVKHTKEFRQYINQFIENGGDVNSLDNKNNNSIGSSLFLFTALKNNNSDALVELLKVNADPRLKDSRGNTVYHVIAANPKLSPYMEHFSKYDIDLNAVNKERKTALNLAIKSNSVEIVENLISLGVNVSAKTKDKPPIVMALDKEEILKALLESGANPNVKMELEFTPLLRVAGKGDITIAKILLKYGADLHYEAKSFGTALHVAAQNGKLEVVKFLLEEGLNANSMTCCGNNVTPLHRVAEYENPNTIKIIDLLLKWGGDINAGGAAGRSPLIYARHRKPEVIEHLIAKGADVNYRDKQNMTALTWFINRKNPAMEVLVKHGARLNLKYGQDRKALSILKETNPLLLGRVIVQ